MTSRQCGIAAEAYAASILAQCGYDILVQYGANQPHYDLAAEKNGRILLISVKGSQDGGWPLCVSHKDSSRTYHKAIDTWLSKQRKDVVLLLVQYLDVPIGDAPRVFLARPGEVASHMKTQCNGVGHGSLSEDWLRDHPAAKRDDRIPPSWLFSSKRIDSI